MGDRLSDTTSDTTYAERILSLNRRLGIPDAYAAERGWLLQPEAHELLDAGPDFYGRPQRLTPAALAAWQRLQSRAAEDGVTLHMISAFRGVDYQFELIRRKLEKGQDIHTVLTVNAAPGYSEHHTGCAMDLGTMDCPALEETFEQTPAFDWLSRHAGRFGFVLSYPRGNAAGICYEPWHWCYRPDLDNAMLKE